MRIVGLVKPLVLAASLGSVVVLQLPVAAGATGSGTLGSIRCSTLPTDPALEAPLYAQNEGASGAANGWWCQLPHATMAPAGFTELARRVTPIADLYSDYVTLYGPNAGGSDGSASGPQIRVTDEVNSSVAPPSHLKYTPVPKGAHVSLGHGVTAVEVRHRQSTTVVWRYPVRGVPKYLRAVAQVSVSGTGVPESAVVGVARHVQPD
jgi:hypothetical protein